ncbi:hypothetical protein [Pseudovibrio japonicus]|nr:hypothetical protein [Pseudovibrio japonicus]
MVTPKKLIAFSVVFVIVSMTLYIISNSTEGPYEDILRNADTGDFIPLRKIFSSKFQQACVVTPYQDQISFDPKIDSKVNNKIAENRIIYSDDMWVLAIVNKSEVLILEFSRKPTLDILDSTLFHRNMGEFYPNFSPKTCVEYSRGGFLKTRLKDRYYVTLGVEE